MAYKNIQNQLSFADIAVAINADKNESLIFLKNINKSINWKPIDFLALNNI